MKKRLTALAALLALALSLSGCGLFGRSRQAIETPPPLPTTTSDLATPEPSATPLPLVDGRVYPAVLTGSEMALLDLFGEDADGWSLYDFTVPEGTQFVSLTLWELSDGAWQRRASDSASMSAGDGERAA